MGEAKRREQRDSSFGQVFQDSQKRLDSIKMGALKIQKDLTYFLTDHEVVRATNRLITNYDMSGVEAVELYRQCGAKIHNQRLLDALKESQGLLIPLLGIAIFAQVASTAKKTEAIHFWDNSWTVSTLILGAANIANPQLCPWLLVLSSGFSHVLDTLRKSLDESAIAEFEHVFYAEDRSLHSLGETTIGLGMAFGYKNIIYAGESLIVYKGVDSGTSLKDRGDLMIACKHASGCWNHYPSSENMKIPLSDYKKAKAKLNEFPISLIGELIHPQSEKLAKLLGLAIKGKYACLIKNK